MASVYGGIRPAVLRQVLADPAYVASGLAARLAFAMPLKQCPRWSDAEVHPDTEAALAGVLGRLQALPFDPRQGPLVVRPEVGARARFVAFSDGLMSRAEDLDGGPMGAALPKLARIPLRLALVHHAVTEAAGRDPGPKSIPDGAMAAGIAPAGWFGHEAERVYAMPAESDTDRDARTLADLVARRGGRVSARASSGRTTRGSRRAPGPRPPWTPWSGPGLRRPRRAAGT